MCRKNASFKIFVDVIPKEALASIGGRGPANPSFGMTPNLQYNVKAAENKSEVVIIPTEGLAGPRLLIPLMV